MDMVAMQAYCSQVAPLGDRSRRAGPGRVAARAVPALPGSTPALAGHKEETR